MTIRRADLDAGLVDLSDVVDPAAPRIGPTHPGEMLRKDYLVPLGLSAYRLAKAIQVPPNRITEIIAGRREVTADTALRLARFFRTDAQSWLNLQTRYDLETARAALGPTHAGRHQADGGVRTGVPASLTPLPPHGAGGPTIPG